MDIPTLHGIRSSFSVLPVLLQLAVFHPTVVAAEKPWIEVRSPHFRVLTDGSRGDARRVALEFEQMRYVFATRYPRMVLDSSAPLLILAARDEQTFRNLEPELYKRSGSKPVGVFHHGWDRQYVTLRYDTWGVGAHELVYYEYTFSVMRMNIRILPVWLGVGLAEFYAYTRFQQHEIYVGSPTERYPILASKALIPIETLISAKSLLPYVHDNTVPMFYEESWALVHFMFYGPGMNGGKKLDQFLALLQEGTEQKKAFSQVFGDFKQMDDNLQLYVNHVALATDVLKNPPQFSDKDFRERTLSLAETEAELSIFHLWMHDLPDARQLAEHAVKEDPKLGLAHEAVGFVHFSEGKDPAALTEFTQASDLDSSLWLSLFARTMLSRLANSDDPADETSFHDAMSKVLALNPRFAQAYIQLARLYLRQNDLKSALAVARKAEQLEPDRAGYHLLSGEVLRRMGRGHEAAEFARFVSERWPGADRDEALELWNAISPEQRPTDEVPSYVPPKQTLSMEGRVVSSGCQDAEPRVTITINRDGKTFSFHEAGPFVRGFSDTIWYGGDLFSLCHHVEGMRAVVRYKAAAGSTYAGNIVSIGIREDVPEAPTKEVPAEAPAKP